MSSKANVEITRLNDSVVMGWVGRLSIAVWRKSPEDMVQWFREEMHTGAARFGEGLGHLPVIEPGTPLFSPTTRRGLMQVSQDYEKELDCIVAVFGGTGFSGAALRAMAVGMMLMVPSAGAKIKLAGDHHEAANHLSKLMPNHEPLLTAACLDEALTTMRTAWAEANASAVAG